MPLDSTNWKQDTETKPDLSKPSLEGLSWLLRHMPESHRWDFRTIDGPDPNGCGSSGCAIGLGCAFWGTETFYYNYKTFAPAPVLDRFFIQGLDSYGVLHRHVTPQMVAQKIDTYLAETRK